MRENRLGIKGWAYGGKYNIERYLYTFHRITGIGLILYLPLHVLVTSQRIKGREAWEALMAPGALLNNPVTHVLEFLLVLAIAFHALNGIRLIFTELGFLVGKPVRPIYPYPANSLIKPRPFSLVLMGLGMVYIVVGLYGIFFLRV